MSQTILLTGSAGFIGSHTAHRLLSLGHRVIGIDNLNDYYNPAWKLHNLAPLKSHPKFTFYKEDILNASKLQEIAAKETPTAIIHLAARAGVRPSIQQPHLYQEVNIAGTLNLLEIAKKHSIKQFVFASSSSVYGNQSQVPFSETDACNEPISPYAATKKAGEMLLHTYAHLYDINCIALRFFTVYGPNGRPDMAPYLFTEAILTGKSITQFGDGSTERDYTYIDDIVSGVVAALDLDRKFEAINLGNHSPVSLRYFIETLEKITGNKMQIQQKPLQPGDVQRTYADTSKAQALLAFAPSTDLETGLKHFVKWYTTHRLPNL